MFEVRTHVFNEDSLFYHDFRSQMNTNSSQLIMLLIDRILMLTSNVDRGMSITHIVRPLMCLYIVFGMNTYACFSTFSMIINHFTIIFDLKRI